MQNIKFKEEINNELTSFYPSIKVVDWNMLTVDNEDIIVVKEKEGDRVKFHLFTTAISKGKFVAIIKISY
jgi:hypothetical protein